ncbi:uncharacterized protein V1513DRAFT_55562 [Lipomyces chichibuensis]|uniref:uncharacterized protein n=1 Tax=Lipomyces chichibuensis TaxID=1546026 RepID=UPI003343EBBA
MVAHRLDEITPLMANQIINSHHHRTTSLGCWESQAKPHHSGYAIVSVSIGFTTNLHLIALIADNRHGELKTALGRSNFDVSHLCHNRTCFNPEHLIVESIQHDGYRQQEPVGVGKNGDELL